MWLRRLFLSALLVAIPFLGWASTFDGSSISKYDGGTITKFCGASLATDTGYCYGKTGCDDYDCTTSCSSCTDDANTNCRTTYTLSAGGAANNKATGLEGVYAKKLTATAGTYTLTDDISLTAANTVYSFAIITFDTLTYDNAASVSIFGPRKADGTKYCRAAIEYVSSAARWYGKTAGGTSATIRTIATGTPYYVWVENVSGAKCTVTVGLTGVKADALSQTVDEDGTMQADQIRLTARTSSTTHDINGVTFDRVRWRTTSAFGDSGAD